MDIQAAQRNGLQPGDVRRAASTLVSLVVTTGLFALLFRFLPEIILTIIGTLMMVLDPLMPGSRFPARLALAGMFGALWPGFDHSEVPITSVTNGVHVPTWVDPLIADFAA